MKSILVPPFQRYHLALPMRQLLSKWPHHDKVRMKKQSLQFSPETTGITQGVKYRLGQLDLATELHPLPSIQGPPRMTWLSRLPLMKVRSVRSFSSRLTSTWKWLKEELAAGRNVWSESVARMILQRDRRESEAHDQCMITSTMYGKGDRREPGVGHSPTSSGPQWLMFGFGTQDCMGQATAGA